MNRVFLIIGVAAVGLAAGAAQAAGSAGAYAEPSRPIAYSNLNAYLRASPKTRAARDWSGPMAPRTGTQVDAAAAGDSAINPGTNNGAMTRGPIDNSLVGPMTNETPNTIHQGSPTVSPQSDLARTQAPLNQAPADNGQPPASNQPVTEQPAQ